MVGNKERLQALQGWKFASMLLSWYNDSTEDLSCPVAEGMCMMIRLEITRDEARMLEMFLLMTTRYREDQVKMYRKLLEDWGTRGGTSETTLQAYADNAQHWMEQCVVMDGIRKRVSESLVAPVKENE